MGLPLRRRTPLYHTSHRAAVRAVDDTAGRRLAVCDQCQKLWVVREDQRDGPYWEQVALGALPAKVQAMVRDSVVPE